MEYRIIKRKGYTGKVYYLAQYLSRGIWYILEESSVRFYMPMQDRKFNSKKEALKALKERQVMMENQEFAEVAEEGTL